MARLDEDYHVHSVYSDDGRSTLAENVRAARDRGLHTMCLAEHVRQDSAGIPEFTAAVAALAPVPGLRLLAGAEAKILDVTGRLDLPGSLTGIDLVLIADHQFPGPDGPCGPGEIRRALARGDLTASEVVESLAEATAAALRQVERASLAHLFSILPKVGLAESVIPGRLLGHLARRARAAGALVEVNEKWDCPSARSLRAFADAGVRIVASTDSHHCADIGVYRRVRQILAGLAERPAGPLAG
jgi:putative hydrolase